MASTVPASLKLSSVPSGASIWVPPAQAASRLIDGTSRSTSPCTRRGAAFTTSPSKLRLTGLAETLATMSACSPAISRRGVVTSRSSSTVSPFQVSAPSAVIGASSEVRLTVMLTPVSSVVWPVSASR